MNNDECPICGAKPGQTGTESIEDVIIDALREIALSSIPVTEEQARDEEARQAAEGPIELPPSLDPDHPDFRGFPWAEKQQ